MKLKILIALITLPFLSNISSANEHYTDLRNVNLVGKVVEVSSPNTLKVETIQFGKRRHFWVELIHVDFGADKNIQCTQKPEFHYPKRMNRQVRTKPALSFSAKSACDRMKIWLNGKIVQVEITEWSQPSLKGFVFHKGTNVNYELISQGEYPVDYRQTRHASLVLLEKKARCQRVGIWQSKKGNVVEDLKCL